MIHDGVRDEMRRVYEDNDIPAFLDATGPRTPCRRAEGVSALWVA